MLTFIKAIIYGSFLAVFCAVPLGIIGSIACSTICFNRHASIETNYAVTNAAVYYGGIGGISLGAVIGLLFGILLSVSKTVKK